ncbi:Hypothetical predicted protein [Mytilus galloprovincialis]|uniref:Uncharacterized protein n=1 Tax=Mytilus galloprovincialis TaxID=29158 RepID=A0A8B6H1N5_MYTGA|nr:Hypothetical predicted protein [Mytilus galloprovincialis]
MRKVLSQREGERRTVIRGRSAVTIGRTNEEGALSQREGERRTVIRGRLLVTIGRENEEGVWAQKKGERRTVIRCHVWKKDQRKGKGKSKEGNFALMDKGKMTLPQTMQDKECQPSCITEERSTVQNR